MWMWYSLYVGSCNPNCFDYFFILMMKQKINVFICIIVFLICKLNDLLYSYIPVLEMREFCTSYLTDIIGATAFIACCNLILSFFQMRFYKLSHIVLFLFFCGIFWEFVTPLYRNTISDIYDIFAYMFGGFLYWILLRLYR